jgi:hypothetical protein
MKKLSFFAAIVCLVLFSGVMAQDVLTNEAVTKLAKAGLSEDIIVNMVKTQPARFQLGADQVLQLKKDGVSDKVVAAMLARGASPGGATAEATAPPDIAKSPVSEVGVYFKKNDAWADLPPEVVNFKTGGVIKSIGTAGIVKGDVNGHINGEHSRSSLKTPVDLLVYAPEGVAITEYQLLRLHDQKDSREFRTVTGGVLHVSGGATRDIVPFENKKVAVRTYEIVLPSLGTGEYGLLPPASSDPTASSGRIGKIYSFRIIE